MQAFHTTEGDTIWREDDGVDCPAADLIKPCLLPTFLAASRLLLRRVLPVASRPPAAPTA